MAIQFHVDETDVDNSLSELAFIVKDELLDHRGIEIGDADLDGAPYTEYVRDGETHRVYFATDASRNVLFYTTATGTFQDVVFSEFKIYHLLHFSVADQVEPLFPQPVTQVEAEAGMVTELRSWSPFRVRQAAVAVTTDQTARDAASDAQTDADANAVDIAANTAALADKLNISDLTNNIESFAVVGDASEIPTARFASDSVTEGKLSPQVRAKLAVSSSQQGENIAWASMTQVEYDALSTYDSDRLYIIVG